MPCSDCEPLLHVQRRQLHHMPHVCICSCACRQFIQHWDLRPRREQEERFYSSQRDCQGFLIAEVSNRDFDLVAKSRPRFRTVPNKHARPLTSLYQLIHYSSPNIPSRSCDQISHISLPPSVGEQTA